MQLDHMNNKSHKHYDIDIQIHLFYTQMGE